MIELKIKPQLSGRLLCEAIGPDGGVRRSTGWFDNIITDSGLNGIGVRNMLIACWCGTGSTTPAAGDTAMVAFVAGTSTVIGSSVSAQGSAPYYGRTTRTFEFPVGAATGNISEVGIASGPNPATPSFMFSRALVLDGGGSPTTITVLSDEKLRVTYELRCYPPLVDVVTTNTINGVSTTVTMRACDVTNVHSWADFIGSYIGTSSAVPTMQVFNGAIGAITASSPAGTMIGFSGLTFGAYSSGSFSIAATGFLDTGTGNGTSTAASIVCAYGKYQIGFSPGIAKTNLQTLTLIFTIAWARKTLP